MTQEISSVDRYQVLLDTNTNFLKDRPLMERNNHASLSTILRMLADEVDEAMETVDEGDKIIEDKRVAIEQELADIGIFLMTAFQVLGSDMYEAIMEKHMRNMLKYPAKLFQDIEGDYTETITHAKKSWLRQGGNEEFYNGYSKYMVDFDKRRLSDDGAKQEESI